MSETLKTQISAFVDEELSEEENGLLLHRLRRDPELRGVTGRYVLIGELMRGARDLGDPGEFSRRVMERLADDKAPAAADASVLPNRMLRYGAGLAIAASVAVAAVLALRFTAGGLPETSPQAVAETTGVVSEAGLFQQPLPVTPAAAPARLQSYVLMHSPYATTLGRPGVLAIAQESEDVAGEEAAEATGEEAARGETVPADSED